MADPQNDVIERVLARTRTIAVVGASRDPGKSAHAIPAMSSSYRIILNRMPSFEPVHRTLASIDEPIDSSTSVLSRCARRREGRHRRRREGRVAPGGHRVR
jgi:predicted CoA-binding protein